MEGDSDSSGEDETPDQHNDTKSEKLESSNKEMKTEAEEGSEVREGKNSGVSDLDWLKSKVTKTEVG